MFFGMDLVSFHRGWLGIDPERTPKEFLVSPRQTYLYGAFPKARGFSSAERDPDLFLGVLILALAQIAPNSGQPVFLFTPKVHDAWVTEQLRTVARYMIRTRKDTPGGVALVKDVLGRVYLNNRPFQTPVEPARWVAFGLQKKDALPSWIIEGLIEVPNV
jgi:hypothetical protein